MRNLFTLSTLPFLLTHLNPARSDGFLKKFEDENFKYTRQTGDGPYTLMEFLLLKKNGLLKQAKPLDDQNKISRDKIERRELKRKQEEDRIIAEEKAKQDAIIQAEKDRLQKIEDEKRAIEQAKWEAEEKIRLEKQRVICFC